MPLCAAWNCLSKCIGVETLRIVRLFRAIFMLRIQKKFGTKIGKNLTKLFKTKE